jgi:hypothetical protein
MWSVRVSINVTSDACPEDGEDLSGVPSHYFLLWFFIPILLPGCFWEHSVVLELHQPFSLCEIMAFPSRRSRHWTRKTPYRPITASNWILEVPSLSPGPPAPEIAKQWLNLVVTCCISVVLWICWFWQ